VSVTTISRQPQEPVKQTPQVPFAVQWRKHGRLITLGKVYQAPDGRLVFGTPYAGRKFHTPSLPLPVIRFLQTIGVCSWIVRFDRLGTAYVFPLDGVERVGIMAAAGELAVNFRHFVRCDYPDWPYAERAVLIEP